MTARGGPGAGPLAGVAGAVGGGRRWRRRLARCLPPPLRHRRASLLGASSAAAAPARGLFHTVPVCTRRRPLSVAASAAAVAVEARARAAERCADVGGWSQEDRPHVQVFWPRPSTSRLDGGSCRRTEVRPWTEPPRKGDGPDAQQVNPSEGGHVQQNMAVPVCFATREVATV